MARVNLKPNLLALLVLVVSGCSKPEAPFIGRWQLSADSFKTGDAKKDAALEQVAIQSTIEFKADKTGTLHALSVTVPFTYVVADKTATISVTPLPGQGSAPPENHTYTLSADGKSLIDGPTEGGQALRYTRIAN